MPFHFALSTLLRYRQSMERQQKLLFQEALRQVAIIRLELERTEGNLSSLVASERAQLTAGVTSAELEFNSLCRTMLHVRCEELGHEMTRRRELLERRREALLEAQRQRETVDTLRERQLQAYRQKERRTEQSRLDEAFLLRREFLRRG